MTPTREIARKIVADRIGVTVAELGDGYYGYGGMIEDITAALDTQAATTKTATRDRVTESDFSKGDWDATAHIRFLRAQGGAGAGYTADLIEKLAAALDAQAAAFAERMDAARKLVEQLKPLATACLSWHEGGWYIADELTKHRAMPEADGAFIAAANPQRIIELALSLSSTGTTDGETTDG